MIDERRDDAIDNNNNWQTIDDIGRDGRIEQQDITQDNGIPDYNEPNFDNTDPQESDQIGLTSFYFASFQEPDMKDSDKLWQAMNPGDFDTTGFNPINGDYTYGSGYFPLSKGQTERFSIAIVYGGTAQEILNNKDIVQEIYDNNYNFSGPPNPPPKLTAIPGDKKVTLYWTNDSEEYFDTFINRKIVGSANFRSPLAKTFEGYKIYKSTDPSFLDARVITGAQGEARQRLKPLVQFDKIDSVSGYFPMGPNLLNQAKGVSFWLGSETGLSHTYVDNGVDNGRIYYYAVAAYSRGYIEPTNPDANIFPAENSISATEDSRGRLILGTNVVVVQPKAAQTGLLDQNSPTGELKPDSLNRASGKVFYTMVNPNKITRERKIKVEFVSTAQDGVDNNNDGSIDDLFEQLEEVTSFFRVIDTTNAAKPDTLLKQSGLVSSSLRPDKFDRFLGNRALYQRAPSGNLLYQASEETRLIDSIGVYFTIQNNGVKTEYDSINSRWKLQSPAPLDALPRVSVAAIEGVDRIDTAAFPDDTIRVIGFAGATVIADGLNQIPDDYALVIRPIGAASSDSATINIIEKSFPDQLPTVRTNFDIYNLTKRRKQRFILEPDEKQKLIGQNRASELTIFLPVSPNYNPNVFDTLFSWRITISSRVGYTAQPGDTLFLRFTKPILGGDNFGFTLKAQQIDRNRTVDALANVKVYPNPYNFTNEAEGNLADGARGRAERAIFFKNVPLNSTIRIYTIRGELIRTLRADNPSGKATETQSYGEKDRNEFGAFAYPSSQVQWNLKTSENLDIAYGVYLYHVDAPGIGTKTGKFAVIK
jgi:hypothetical protein